MECWQVLTNSKPFPHIKSDRKVFWHVVGGLRPKRSHCEQINDIVWNMLEMCWNKDPSRRPSMATLAQFFAQHSDSLGQ
jgi:hypothetical protein